MKALPKYSNSNIKHAIKTTVLCSEDINSDYEHTVIVSLYSIYFLWPLGKVSFLFLLIRLLGILVYFIEVMRI